MSRRVKNRAWAERLGTREYTGGGACPNRCTRGGLPAAIIDYSHVPGVGCSVCGAYWIPPERAEVTP